MLSRKKFLQLSGLSLPAIFIKKLPAKTVQKPIVISTWEVGVNANAAAWSVLSQKGSALDAVEQGVKVTEDEMGCCVGLAGNPDREGIVTLDASIMDHQFNCGSVAFLERIKHPISVARKVMEKTPHVMLVGSGAQQFALQQGFSLEPQELSPKAEKKYKEWLKKTEYKPVMNIENKKDLSYAVPTKFSNGEFNHDTIGMLALDSLGNLAGSCTTSGMGFKMRGRVGDSPIIGSGLYVDNAVGAAVATGHGEEAIRICGTHLVVEFMRSGYSPEIACKKAIERIVNIKGLTKSKDIQVAFIALNKHGDYGAYCINKGFSYAAYSNTCNNQLITPKNLI